MSEEKQIVFIVDDDVAVCESLKLMLDTIGISTSIFHNAADFLNNYCNESGCVVLDVRMPGMSGIELQSKMRAHDIYIPVIIITGHGDISMAVEAVKAGALDFIEKPFRNQVLLDAIQKALALDRDLRGSRTKKGDAKSKVLKLTNREKEIMRKLIEGKPNKVIGMELGISTKTVDFHRLNILDKMGANNVVELVKIVEGVDY